MLVRLTARRVYDGYGQYRKQHLTARGAPVNCRASNGRGGREGKEVDTICLYDKVIIRVWHAKSEKN